MEMGAAQLAMRMLGSVGRLDQHRLRTGRLVDDDWPRMTSRAILKMRKRRCTSTRRRRSDALELRARARAACIASAASSA
jgi:replicative DNA helicase